MGPYFNYYSLIDGEGGYNTLKIAENYEGNLDAIHNIQQIDLAGGFSYEMGTGSNPAPSGQAFTVDAAALGTGDTIDFIASDDPLGTYIFDGRAGINDITLNNQADVVNCGTGTNDIVDCKFRCRAHPRYRREPIACRRCRAVHAERRQSCRTHVSHHRRERCGRISGGHDLVIELTGATNLSQFSLADFTS
jgi:hypothetical protein